MSAIAFDTLKLARRLEAAGFSAGQAGGAAEALAETLRESLGERIVTREYLDMRLADLKTDLAGRIAEAKLDQMRWTVGMLVGQTAVIAALVKLL